MNYVDMHVHLKNRSQCSNLTIKQILQKISPNIGGICITDHNICEIYPNLDKCGISFFFGAELTCYIDEFEKILGDVLVYGINEIPLHKTNLESLISFVHKNKGVIIPAHPFSKERNSFQENIINFDFDAIEINGSISNKENRKAKEFSRIMRLPTIGGSDAHSFNALNTYATKFDIEVKCLNDIIFAIKNCKCNEIKI